MNRVYIWSTIATEDSSLGAMPVEGVRDTPYIQVSVRLHCCVVVHRQTRRSGCFDKSGGGSALSGVERLGNGSIAVHRWIPVFVYMNERC